MFARPMTSLPSDLVDKLIQARFQKLAYPNFRYFLKFKMYRSTFVQSSLDAMYLGLEASYFPRYDPFLLD
jgi:hypothetical protein